MSEQEMIKVPKKEFEYLKKKAQILKQLEEKLDFDLIRQFAESLEDLKQGRFRKLAWQFFLLKF